MKPITVPDCGYTDATVHSKINSLTQTFGIALITLLTVLIIAAATLYGSAFEAGLLSSNHPFHPLSTVAIGILIEAPLSEIPKENFLID